LFGDGGRYKSFTRAEKCFWFGAVAKEIMGALFTWAFASIQNACPSFKFLGIDSEVENSSV
jgi:hypothetical protein